MEILIIAALAWIFLVYRGSNAAQKEKYRKALHKAMGAARKQALESRWDDDDKDFTYRAKKLDAHRPYISRNEEPVIKRSSTGPVVQRVPKLFNPIDYD